MDGQAFARSRTVHPQSGRAQINGPGRALPGIAEAEA